MKYMKKLTSLLLALLMVMGLTGTALAADSGSITVDNPRNEQTYTAYKIFDVTYNSDKSAYSYTIAGNSEWFGTVQAFASASGSGMTLTKAGDDTNVYVVTTTNAFSAPKFAKALQADRAGKTGTQLNVAGGKASVSGLPLGYYFVTSSTGALCNLTTTDPNVTIHDKNDVPFDKVDDKESVDVGETVTYTITGKVPDTTGFTEYTYEINDTMSEGLTFNKNSIEVKIDGTVINDADITCNVDGNANKFKISIPVMNYKAKVGKTITVTYTAVVNEKAAAKIENNKATLTYSHDPTDATKTTTTPEDIETVYSAKIIIDKYKADSAETKLAGAKFVLYKENQSSKLYYKWNSTDKQVEWVSNQSDATEVTTDDNGAAEFIGLKDGTYYLVETEAPAGYNKLTDAVSVTINGASAVAADLSSLTVTQKIANQTGSTLPETGGMGTRMFYLVGAVLVAGAGVLLITRRRMSE